MIDDDELAFAGAARQAELLREGEVSSERLVELSLERIERLGPALNAFVDVFAEEARAAAREADERLAAGGGEAALLLGVPIALKDETDVIAGRVAGHGTRAFEESAADDSAHVARLRAAGAILVGRTTLPELAICGFTETETHGETRNPWSLAHSPGGSSGGSAAAVAAGLVAAASASDGAGSIRIPAASCGLFGLKPQRGRISLAPWREHWLGMTVAGCVTRHVADSALWLDVAAGPEPIDAHSPPPPGDSYAAAARRDPGALRIATSVAAPPGALPATLQPEVSAAVERVGGALREAGHSVAGRDPDWGLLGPDAITLYLKGIETAYDEVPHPERLEPRTRGFKRLARLTPARARERALRRIEEHAARVNSIFDDFDLILMPTMAEPAVEVGRWAGRGALRTLLGMGRVYPYTIAWNYLGNPAAAVPAGLGEDGRPLSVQLVAPPNGEERLLSVAAQLEGLLGWPAERPPLPG